LPIFTTKTIIDEDARASFIYMMLCPVIFSPLMNEIVNFAKKKQNKKNALTHPKDISVSISMLPF
jgi:hypothetical protein